MRVTVDRNVSDSERQLIQREVVAYSDAVASPRNFRNIAVVLRDESSTVVGGVVAFVAWDWLLVDILWVSAGLRGNGYGRLLMAEVEKAAIELGCRNARLDTFDFEAKGFYQKLGYFEYGALEGFPQHHTQFHLRKNLLDA